MCCCATAVCTGPLATLCSSASHCAGSGTCATASWNWLISGGSLEVQQAALGEITDAWLATATQRMGLFAPHPGAAEPPPKMSAAAGDGAAAGGDDGGDALLQGVVAHHAWVVFLVEIWNARRQDLSGLQTAVAGQYWRLLAGTLLSQQPLCRHPASAGARFRLLHLALRFMCAGVRAPADQRAPAFDALALYRGILAATLDWFAGPVAWHEAERPAAR